MPAPNMKSSRWSSIWRLKCAIGLAYALRTARCCCSTPDAITGHGTSPWRARHEHGMWTGGAAIAKCIEREGTVQACQLARAGRASDHLASRAIVRHREPRTTVSPVNTPRCNVQTVRTPRRAPLKMPLNQLLTGPNAIRKETVCSKRICGGRRAHRSQFWSHSSPVRGHTLAVRWPELGSGLP